MKLRQSSHVGTSSDRSGGCGSRSKLSRMSGSRYKRASLSMINEGDELTKLQDVLNARKCWLKQEELWAVCRESCLTLKRISNSTETLQSLCVMLETLAFDSQGNVCFIDHESDPDHHYRPPEYGKVGNTTKGFIYSLGLVLYEASAYNSESFKIPPHSPRLRKLLKSMMEPDYSERINLDGVIQECNLLFKSAGGLSSLEICKDLVRSTTQIPTQSNVYLHGNSFFNSSKSSSDNNADSKPSSTSSSLQPPTTSADMDLQELIDKYQPSRLQGDEESHPDEVLILSPPEEFGSRMNTDSEANSAFQPKQQRSKNINPSEAAEGASLIAHSTPLRLPEAYRSSATHFSPIVLANHEKKAGTSRFTSAKMVSKTDRTLIKLKKQLLKSHIAQEGEAKMSPQDNSSPQKVEINSEETPSINSEETPSMKSQEAPPTNSQESKDFTELDIVKPVASGGSNSVNKPTPAPKPPIPPQIRDRTGASTPVTQAVKPVPRQSDNQTSNISNESQIISNNDNNNNNSNNSNTPTASVQPTNMQSSNSSPALPIVSNAQTTQPLVMNGATLSSPAIISSYPVMLQRDSATGAVSWIPVVPNTTPYNIAPYWTMSPQQVIPTIPQQQVITASPHQLNLSESSSSNAQQSNTSEQQTVEPPIQNDTTVVSGMSSHSQQPQPKSRCSGSSKSHAPPAPVKKTKMARTVQNKDGDSQAKATKRREGTTISDDKENVMLMNLRQLLKNEFAFDGYMEHGQEDMVMARFIGSLLLPSLEYRDWCNIIVAKYGDLYWSDELLAALYQVIHDKPAPTERPPSGTLRTKSAEVISVDEPLSNKEEKKSKKAVPTERYTTSPFRPIPLNQTESNNIKNSTPAHSSVVKPTPVLPQYTTVHHTDTGAVDVAFTQAPLPLGLCRMKSASVQDLNVEAEDLSRQIFQPSAAVLVKSKSQSNLMKNSKSGPVITASMTPLVKSLILPNGGTRQVVYIEGKNTNPLYDDFWTNRAGSASSAFEQESDSQSHSSASELRVKGRLQSSSYAMGSSTYDEQFNDGIFGSKLSSEHESDSNLTRHVQQVTGVSRICYVIIYASYLAQNKQTASMLCEKVENKSADGLNKKMADLNQQINVYFKGRNKALKYIKKIVESSQKISKGSADYKAILSQIKSEYQESVKEIDHLLNAKLQLEVLVTEQSSIDVSCLYSLTKLVNPMVVIETNNNPTLQFQTQRDPVSNKEIEVLYAGHPTGLLSYLYAKGALESGYILEFFHSFRYFIDSPSLLSFISEKYTSAREMKPCETRDKVMKRSIDLLVFWVTSYYTADFCELNTLTSMLVNFLQDEVYSDYQPASDFLLRLVDEYENDKGKNSTFCDPIPHEDELPYIEEDSSNPLARKASLRRSASLLRKTELDEWCEDSKWNSTKIILTIGSGKSSVQYRRTRTGITCVTSQKKSKETPQKIGVKDAFSLADYTAADIAEQLTLIEQLIFNDVHPVHFMNTLAQGIGASLADGTADAIPQNEKRLMFQSGYMQVVALVPMIQHAKKVAHWVTAEIINAGSAKAQISLLTKFIQVAKICKDIRNFATCIAIKDGLDHMLIRHITAWKEIPAKLIQELDDVKLIHKTDPNALKQDDTEPGLPTIPCALLFALQVQQYEKGGFNLANGMFRWPKLKSLAHLVDIIRLCKRFSYQLTENSELSESLANRMAEMFSHSLETLAITASSESARPTGSAAANRWTNVFKKMKGKR